MHKKIVDLTHLLNEDITVYPGTPAPKFTEIARVGEEGYAEMKAELVLHVGTHIDAPNHVIQDGKSLDQFLPEKFTGPAMVINCVGRKDIDLAFLKQFERQLMTCDFILLYTGWQHKWKTDGYFEDCPVLTSESANWLLKFNLKGVGLDAFSVDPVIEAEKVSPETLPFHHLFLGKEILLIENLTNLDLLPSSPFLFQCFPLRIEKADGSPVRALAFV